MIWSAVFGVLNDHILLLDVAFLDLEGHIYTGKLLIEDIYLLQHDVMLCSTAPDCCPYGIKVYRLSYRSMLVDSTHW